MQTDALCLQNGAARVAIIGAGIIGLSCAVELATRGAAVSLYDKADPGRGASWAAAGMLAPAFEAAGGEDVHPFLFDLCQLSRELWPAFASSLEARSGASVGFQPGPSLALAVDAGEAARLDAIAVKLREQEVAFETLTPAQARLREPALRGGFAHALGLPSDGHVDNRLVVRALVDLCQASDRIEIIANQNIRDAACLLQDHDAVLCTAGWQSGDLLGEASCIDPVGGQLLAVEKLRDAPTTTIRQGSLYIAPKADRIVIGATVEPGRAQSEADLATALELRRAASRICPGLAQAEILEMWAGVRPGTPDHAPLFGQVEGEAIFVATGHYRNGILLAPITAQIMADMILARQVNELAAAFSPARFAPAPV